MLSPTVNGSRPTTSYAYDAQGNVQENVTENSPNEMSREIWTTTAATHGRTKIVQKWNSDKKVWE